MSTPILCVLRDLIELTEDTDPSVESTEAERAALLQALADLTERYTEIARLRAPKGYERKPAAPDVDTLVPAAHKYTAINTRDVPVQVAPGVTLIPGGNWLDRVDFEPPEGVLLYPPGQEPLPYTLTQAGYRRRAFTLAKLGRVDLLRAVIPSLTNGRCVGAMPIHSLDRAEAERALAQMEAPPAAPRMSYGKPKAQPSPRGIF